jgi:hypothetical protein
MPLDSACLPGHSWRTQSVDRDDEVQPGENRREADDENADHCRASIQTKASYFHARFYLIARRPGPEKAAVTVAQSQLVVIYHMVTNGKPYVELHVD